MLLSLSSAMRSKSGANGRVSAATSTTVTLPTPSTPSTHASAPAGDVHTPTAAVTCRGDVVGETPEGAKASHAAAVVTDKPSTAKKQRSIHDFFGSGRAVVATPVDRKRRSLASASASTPASASATNDHHHNSSSHSLFDSQEGIKKRIDYDDSSSLDGDDDDDDALELSQNSEAATTTPQPPRAAHALSVSISVVKPKRIDFGGICPSSQRSEPDGEPPEVVVSNGNGTPGPGDVSLSRSQSASSQGFYSGYGGYSAYGGGGGMFSQDDLDFCTPADQPVVHMSHPTTPSPMKKRQRRTEVSEPDVVHDPEEVQNLTQDMTHMDVRRPSAVAAPVKAARAPRALGAKHAPLPSFSSSSDSHDMLLATPQRVLGLPTGFPAGTKRRDGGGAVPKSLDGSGGLFSSEPTLAKAAPPPASEAFTNPFAPLPAIDSRKRRKLRQSFPPTFGSGSGSFSVPYSRYLSEFVEQELLGSGAFSKVFKCVKKIDGWTYAIKKSKRHLRGRADTERALREVQALAALSDSRHVVRYFDAWIEDDLLYIQLENCASCSLTALVDAHKPLHIPEETLCKVLSHLAQALQDMHAKQMVHMDVKLPNVLVAPGEIYKLGDLGTAARADGSMEITEGDNRYLSRELLEGSRANLKAGDVFALGATIYELALGATLPANGEEWQKIRDGDLSLFRQYTNSLQHLIASMMHPDPLQRPSAEEILQHEVVRPFYL